jgi:hypothetical protein
MAVQQQARAVAVPLQLRVGLQGFEAPCQLRHHAGQAAGGSDLQRLALGGGG